ncbi:hypothetical protein [Nocardioides dongkuii]|uniref:hypothetical protein n=1 Tax=Nocardioides dongkuii TaxID=2760089 RepID=UPI0015FB3B42|nr:hypothetical protein [Nocardioides dongkuii]
MHRLLLSLLRAQALVVLVLTAPRRRDDRDERGDVPGWVMIVVMTASLVAVLTAAARPQLKSMLDEALSSVR